MVEMNLPKDEQSRIASLIGLNILDTPAEDRFDRITRLAAKVFQVPMALVSLVDRDRQWFKSSCGLDAAETERNIAFCSHAILDGDVMVVPNALKDVRFADNPLVVGEPHIRFYAGYPLSGPEGHKLGTLCIIDQKPRELGEEEREQLRDLGRMIENELAVSRLGEVQAGLVEERDEARRKAMVDPLTRLWNRGAILEVLDREIERIRRGVGVVSVVRAEVDFYGRITGEWGPAAGQPVLRYVAQRLRAWTRTYDAVGRYGEAEFLVVMPGCTRADAALKAETIRRVVAAVPVSVGEGRRVCVTLSAGVAEGRGSSRELIDAAEGALRRGREAGLNRVVVA
jgi:diguanylate cyclase (GGDEF)-like protein